MTQVNLALLVLIACVAALPLFGGAYALRVGTIGCMYAIFALSWNIVGGFGGYPPFAPATFFGFCRHSPGDGLAGDVRPARRGARHGAAAAARALLPDRQPLIGRGISRTGQQRHGSD